MKISSACGSIDSGFPSQLASENQSFDLLEEQNGPTEPCSNHSSFNGETDIDTSSLPSSNCDNADDKLQQEFLEQVASIAARNSMEKSISLQLDDRQSSSQDLHAQRRRCGTAPSSMLVIQKLREMKLKREQFDDGYAENTDTEVGSGKMLEKTKFAALGEPAVTNLTPKRIFIPSRSALFATCTVSNRFCSSIPFIDPVDVFQVTSEGGQYTKHSLGVHIDVPKGAVPNGSLLSLEIGVCVWGPFDFPAESTPIAPILMICPQQCTQLQKPVKVTLPHMICEATAEDVKALGMQVIKADHTSLVSCSRCRFEDLDHKEYQLSLYTKDDKSYAKVLISHFCFISLRADNRIAEVAKRKGYCICPMYPLAEDMVSGTITYHLCVTYFMDACLEGIKEQFLKKGYELREYQVKKFTFTDIKRASIQAAIANKDQISHDWLVWFEDCTVITAASVDLWKKELDILKTEVKYLLYPPCFHITACGKKATRPAYIKLCFNTDDFEKNRIFMRLPLTRATACCRTTAKTDVRECQVTSKLLMEELKALTKPVEFAIQLDVPKKVIDKLQKDHYHSVDHQTIFLFGYIVDNWHYLGMSWSKIADALEAVDLGDLSLTIRAKYSRL